MIRCARCAYPNLTGAVFCIECGVMLVGPAAPEARPTAATGAPGPRRPSSTTGTWATLYPETGDQAFQLGEREEFTLGRSDDSRSRKPDIDLSPIGAYAKGVSRMHAVIRHRHDQIVIMDMDSANGTYVNGRRVGSGQEAGLSDGDMIALGALKLQVRVKTMQ